MNPGEQYGINEYEGTFSDTGKKVIEKEKKAKDNMVDFLRMYKERVHGGYLLLVDQLKLYVEKGEYPDEWVIKNLEEAVKKDNENLSFDFKTDLAEELLEEMGEEIKK